MSPIEWVPACVYVDFDGTIAPDEPTDALFDRFADPAWRDAEKAWQAGLLTSRECMQQQIELLRATPEQLVEFLAGISIDRNFPAFARLCRRLGMPIVVVSDGLDLVVGTALDAAGLKLPFFANRLEFRGGDRWGLTFPYSRPGCSMGNCKCSHSSLSSDTARILVGDGRSDFCMADNADLVLAKAKLADHCRSMGINHHRIDNFLDATQVLIAWSRESDRLERHDS